MSLEEFAQLKSEPPKEKQPLINANDIKMDKAVNVAGFYLPPKALKKKEEDENRLIENFDNSLKLDDKTDKDLNNNTDADVVDVVGDDEEDDGEGWITPGNLEEMKKLSQLSCEEKEIKDSQITVGCMTSDFSMQVLIHLLFNNI